MRAVRNIIDGILVEIYEKPIKDEKRSANSNIPIYEKRVYIKKKAANSRDEYNQPVKETDRQKYAELFAAFEAGQDVELDGTPIEQWAALDVADVETLKSINVLTIQSAAKIPETTLHRMPIGLKNINVKAQKWLNSINEVDELRKQNADLLKRVTQLEANQKKTPGRKKTKVA
jgi:hypothetical protein